MPVSHLSVLNRANFVILLCDLTFQLDRRLCLRWSINAITMYPMGEQLRAQHSECFYLHLTCWNTFVSVFYSTAISWGFLMPHVFVVYELHLKPDVCIHTRCIL